VPIYEFKTDGGKVVEEFFPSSQAPSIGSRHVIKGQSAVRIVSSGIQAAPDVKPYVSPSLPKNYPGCPTDHRGFSIVTSREHEAQIKSREGL
jgi:hypothetical protein